MADLDFTAAATRGRERLEAPDVTPPLEGAPVPPAPAAPPASLEPVGGAPRLPAGPKVPDFAGAAARGAQRLGQEEDLRAGMAAFRATQTDLTPEKGVEIAQLARATGKPVQFVADNLDDLRRSVDADRLKAQLLESPALQEMLLDPAKAGVLKDQIADANTWEWWFGRWDLKPNQISGPDGKPLLQFPMPELALGPAWARAGVAGAQEQRITYLANKQVLGVSTSEEDQQLADLEAKYGNRDFGANNPFTKGVVGGVKMAPYMLGSAVARVAGGAAAAPAGPAGIAVGQYAGGAAWDFYQNVGPLYRQLRTLKRGDGTPLLSDDEARAYAVPISAGISAFTSGLGGVALRGFPLTKELLEKATRKGVEKAFVEVGGEQAVKSFLTRYGTHVAAGGAMMAVQGGGNAAAAELAKGQHGEEWSVRPVVDAAAHAFLTGIQDMSLIAAWGPGREYLRERGLRTAVDAESARYQGIAEQAAASPILERLKEHPDQAQAILGKLSLGQSAFADPVGWDTYWTAKKFNPRDVAAEIAGDGGRAYDQAKAGTAPDLVLPLDRYLARFGKTEHMLGLQPDLKLAADGLTPRQAKVRDELNAKLDAAELPPAEKDAFVEQLDGFEAAMVEQLRGRSPLEAQSLAKVLRAALTGMALKESLQPADILQKYPLKFEVFGQPRPGASSTPRPIAPAPVAAEVPSAVLAKELGDLDPGIQRAVAARVAGALRGDRAALAELARGEAPAGDTAKAWALLRKGEAAPGLEDLVQAAREAAVARGEGEVPKAIRAKLDKVDAQIRKTELERQKGAVVEAAKAAGGDTKAAAKRAKADLEARLREPLKAPSSTRTERVVLAKDADGLNFAAAHPRGEAAPEGGTLRDVKLPTWLPVDAFLEDRAAWDWTFAAVGGPEAPEQLAKLVHGYMALAMQEFDPKSTDRVIHQAWTVARLAQGKGGKKLASLRKTLADWAKLPEAERPVDPIPEKAWGTVLWRASKDTERITLSRHSYERKVDAWEKWLSSTKGELDPARATFNERPPAWYGKPEDGAAPHPLDAKLAELRAQRATLEAEGKAAAVAGAKPKILLDREAVARALGAETDTAFRNLTGPGGLAPDELAKRLGWSSGDAMLAAMAREHRDADGGIALAQLDVGPVVVNLGQPVRSVTGAPEFKAWFGDSKVVDEGGNPRRLFHGTNRDIRAFDKYALTWAAEDAALANAYAKAKEREVFGGPAQNYPLFLKVERPLRLDVDAGLLYTPEEARAQVGFDFKVRHLREGESYPLHQFLNTRAFRDAAERAGYDGIAIAERGTVTWAAFRPEQVKSAIGNRGTFDPNDPSILRQDRRGEIQFIPPDAAGKPVEFNARILEGADESTAAHELGHWLGLVLGQIAGEPSSSAEHQALYRIALDHMGYKDHPERLAALAEQAALSAKVKADKATDADRARLRALEGKEEKLSFAFEQVLAEGKAPSPELAPVFARYKLWLNRIYRGIENLEARYEKDYGQKLALSDEVRGMFQRLLASEEQIAQAERDYDAAAFRAVLKELDPESADEVEKAAAARRSAAEARLYQVLTEESRREQDQFFAGERDRLRADVESELDVQPVYQALRWLREGALPEGRLAPHELKAEDGKPRLLDRAELIERYGADFVRTLPPGLTTRDPARAVPADILAEGFGFKTGDELVRTLQKTPSRAEEVQRQVQDRLEALYPTLKNHPEKLAEAAVDAQHTPERAAEIMQGIRILTRKLLPEMAAAAKAIDLGKVQETAARLVGERSIADASPGRAALAERKATKETLELLAKASREPNEKNRKELAAAAWDAYQVQLLNHFVYLEAKRTREEGDTLRGKMQRLAGDANMRRLVKAGDEYVDRVKELLRTIEFSSSASMAAVHRRGEYVAAAKGDPQAAGAMLAWLEKQRALNRDPYVPQAVLDLLGRTTHWKDLRLDQLQELHDTVESISHVAHTKDRLKTRAGEVEKLKAIEEMAARLQDTFGTTGIVVSRNTVAWKRRALEGWRKFRAGTIGAEELFRELDGGDPNGPFTRLLWRPVSESADAWNALVLKTTKPILEHLEKLTKEDLKRWRDNRFTVKGQTYTLEEAMAVLLNSMNDSNRNKLEKGWSGTWVDKYGLERWDAGTRMEFVRQLHEKDADLAQQIVDSLETLWPEMEALEKRVQGVAPPKINAKAFTLWFNPDGSSAEPNAPGAHAKEYRGGYYPVVFDHRFSSAGSRQEENAHALTVGGLFQAGAERAITPHGHMNKRVEDFARPVDLSLSALFRHLPHATKDIAMREALIGAHGIITDSRFRAEVMKTAGEPALKFLDKWILDAANELVVKDGGEGAFLSAVGATRRGVTGAVFSLNAAQALQNLTGVANAMTRVDAAYMQKGISKISSDRSKAIEEIAALSPYMASRAVTSDKDLAQNFRETLGKTGPLHRAQEVGMWGFQASDRVVSHATWWGAYEQALAGKVEGVKADQADAVAWADSVVRLSLMSGRTIDLAAIQRHQLGKFLTMFYGWGRAQLDQLIGAGTDARVAWNDGQKLRALRRLTRVFFWVAAGAVLSDLVTGKAPTDDDEDGKVDGKDWSKWAVRRAAMQPLSGVPLAGQVVRAAIDDRKNVSLSPTERVYSGAAQTLSSAWKVGKAWAEDDDYQDELRNFGQHAVETAATVGGLPVAQAKATLGYWMDEERDRSAPVGEDVLGTLYGKRRKGTMLGAVYEE